MQELAASFHPLVWDWFVHRFQQPTPAQIAGWPFLRRGVHTLIAAPTGGGKTLAAFFVAIDQLVQQALQGTLPDGIQIVYLSPLRALSNDIRKNLQQPLDEIMERLNAAGLKPSPIRIGLRTGDTTAYERARLLKHPPHILVTTPESLFLMLSSAKARATLATTRTVIVDEIHAMARDKRGSHLSLSLENLSALCAEEPVRIGLSATQKPLELIAGFLVGAERHCELIDVSQQRDADLDIVLPDLPLGAICSHEMWAEIYEKLAEMIRSHQSSLIFVNTRRMAERITFQLSEMLGEEAVACHHGSLSKEKRLDAEDRLKRGAIKAIIATASLELGIDIGTIDLVCQIGSPRSIAGFVQRVGRSGHALGLTPKARLFALTRDELIECLALLRAYREGAMDRIEIPERPIDILAQHLVSMVAVAEQSPAQLLALCRRAYPYRNLDQPTVDKILEWLSEGLGASTRRGCYLHWDKLNEQLRPRRNARLAVITSGGAIPEQNLYRVVNTTDQSFVGTVDEEFAIESARGDIFLLGNQSWQIEGLKGDILQVSDRSGAPPTIPFWKGEAGGRTFELSAEVGRLREEAEILLGEAESDFQPREKSGDKTHNDIAWRAYYQTLATHFSVVYGVNAALAEQAASYLAAQKLAIGLLPSQKRVVYERFFDETGGMQLIVHAPFGSRVNRAWGLAFRKRFCRGFDFELQASATDNGLLLSVGPQQSFPLESMFRMLTPQNCRSILVQALLDVPMFEIRWRWNVTRSLAVLRSKGGKRVPPHLQRYQSNDLLTAVFPAQTQCFEHRTGDLEVPDHPLVQQTVEDCLQEAMDARRFEEVMQGIERQEIELLARDTREPSPFCYELIHANPYAFLDEAPLEERRVRALGTRRVLTPDSFQDLTALSPEAISQVTSEAWPWIRDADELYEALKQLVLIDGESLGTAQAFLPELERQKRVLRFALKNQNFFAAYERLPWIHALYPLEFPESGIDPSDPLRWDEQTQALKALLRGQLECRGPSTTQWFATTFHLAEGSIEAALAELEGLGIILSGHFLQGQPRQWCERRLLQRMHRLTIEGLREQIKPVPLSVYLRYLAQHQHLTPDSQLSGAQGLMAVIDQLQGIEAPAAVWENEILMSRLKDFNPRELDQLCLSGQALWGRVRVPRSQSEKPNTNRLFTRQTKICFALRQALPWILPLERGLAEERLSEKARLLWKLMEQGGALFFDELIRRSRLLPTELQDVLSELMSMGMVHADSFAAIRPLINPDRKLRAPVRHARQSRYESDFQNGGRYAPFAQFIERPQEWLEAWAEQLLKRYGIVFRDIVLREELAPRWGELVPVFRTLEARGQIRGGRFIEKVGGEQFAAKDAVETLRKLRDEKPSEDFLVLSAGDPLNLMGHLGEDAKIPQLSQNRVLLWKGQFVAWKNRSQIEFAAIDLSPSLKASMERALRLNGMFRRHDPFCQPPREEGEREGAKVINLRNWRQALT